MELDERVLYIEKRICTSFGISTEEIRKAFGNRSAANVTTSTSTSARHGGPVSAIDASLPDEISLTAQSHQSGSSSLVVHSRSLHQHHSSSISAFLDDPDVKSIFFWRLKAVSPTSSDLVKEKTVIPASLPRPPSTARQTRSSSPTRPSTAFPGRHTNFHQESLTSPQSSYSFSFHSNKRSPARPSTAPVEPSKRMLSISDSNSSAADHKFTLFVSCNPPAAPPGTKIVVVRKVIGFATVTPNNIIESLSISECDSDVWAEISFLCYDVYYPLLSSTRFQKHFNEVDPQKILGHFHRLLEGIQVTVGHLEGNAVLPLPPENHAASISAFAKPPGSAGNVLISHSPTSQNSHRIRIKSGKSKNSRQGSGKGSKLKDLIHVYESAVVSWMKLIKNTLKMEQRTHDNQDPSLTYIPLVLKECEAYKIHMQRLNAISKQLQKPGVRKVISMLESAHSTYVSSFKELEITLKKSVEATEEISFYLNVLEPCFKEIFVMRVVDKPHAVAKMFHLLFLAWKSSNILRDNNRLVRLIKIIVEDTVQLAKSLIDKATLVSFSDGLPSQLKRALKVCAIVRGSYQNGAINAKNEIKKMKELEESSFSFRKHKASVSKGHTVEWPSRNHHIFDELNSFADRCNDVLDLVETIHQFQSLEGLVFGGMASKSLEYALEDSLQSFRVILANLKQSKIRLLSSSARRVFDQHYFEFSLVAKRLERGLANIFVEAMNYSETTQGKIIIVEQFSILLTRHEVFKVAQAPIVKFLKEIKDIIGSLDQSLNLSDGTAMTSPFFFNAHAYLPPTTRKLFCLKSIGSLLSVIVDALKYLPRDTALEHLILEIEKMHDDLDKKIEREMSSTKADFRLDMMQLNRSKLGKTLLIEFGASIGEHAEALGISPKIVNFDKNLDRVVKEMRYHRDFDIKAPKQAIAIAHRVEELYSKRAHLEQICLGYKQLGDSVLFFERALFQEKILTMNDIMNRGSKELTWKSGGIDDFINEAEVFVVQGLADNIKQTRINYNAILQELAKWSSHPDCGGAFSKITDEFSGPYNAAEFISRHEQKIKRHISSISIGCKKIQALVESTFNLSFVSRTSPGWLHFIEHIDECIFDGIKRCVIMSFLQMLRVLDPSRAEALEMPPLIVMVVELIGTDIRCSPSPIDTYCTRSLGEMVESWIVDIMKIADHVTPLGQLLEDVKLKRVDFSTSLRTNRPVARLITQIRRCSLETCVICKRHVESFEIFRFLYHNKIQDSFDRFLCRNSSIERVPQRAIHRLNSALSSRSSSSVFLSPAAKNHKEGGEHKKSSDSESHDLALIADVPPKSIPTLEEFDEMMMAYLGARTKVSGMANFKRAWWVTIDIRPAKYAINTWASRWTTKFSDHLLNIATNCLANLKSFFQPAEMHVIEDSNEDSNSQSMTDKVCILQEIGIKWNSIEQKLGPLQRLLNMLLKYDCRPNAQDFEFYLSLPSRWSRLKSKTVHKKKELVPKIAERAEEIASDVIRINAKIYGVLWRSKSCAIFSAHSTRNSMQEILDKLEKGLHDLMINARRVTLLQQLIGSTKYPNISILKYVSQRFACLQDVWSLAEFITDQLSPIMSTCWISADHSLLLALTRQHEKMVATLRERHYALDDIEVGKALVEKVTIHVVLAPLIAQLKETRLQVRHWKRLFRICGVPSERQSIKDLTLGELMEWNMHTKTKAVKSIINEAAQDESCSSFLKYVSEYWSRAKVSFRKYECVSSLENMSKNGKRNLAKSIRTLRKGHERKDTGVVASLLDLNKIKETKDKTSIQNDANLVSNSGHSVGGKEVETEENLSNKSYTPISDFLVTESSVDFIPIMDPSASLLRTLESQLIELQAFISMRDSLQGADIFHAEIREKQKELCEVEVNLRLFSHVQHLWLRMVDIFNIGAFHNTKNLTHDLRAAKSSFIKCDLEFRNMMKDASARSNVVRVCAWNGLTHKLRKMTRILERCQHSVRSFLDSKREEFPRFYFVSGVELVEIAHFCQNPNTCGKALSIAFPGILSASLAKKTKDDNSDTVIESVKLVSGQKMKFECPSKTSVDICVAMKNFETAAVDQLKKNVQLLLVLLQGQDRHVSDDADKIKNNILINNSSTVGYFLSSPSLWEELSTSHLVESVLLALNINFTSETEATITSSDNNRDAFDNMVHNREAIVASVTSLLKLKVTKSKINRIGSFLGLVFHARDISIRLRDQSRHNMGFSDNDFLWQMQLRYYVGNNDGCEIRTSGGVVDYGYELIGKESRLVITPCTERCFLSLIQGVFTYKGSACIGTTASGKTETIQELAEALGHKLVSISCSGYLDFSALGDILKGIATSGAWTCFENLNNMPSRLLTVLCASIGNIASSYSQKTASIDLLGKSVNIGTDFACFLTFTANTKEQFPPQLETAFRCTWKTAPCSYIMTEAFLRFCGFQNCKSIARKIVQVHSLSKALFFSKAYDWGLRTLKSIVQFATQRQINSSDIEQEERLIANVLYDYNHARIHKKDIITFDEIFNSVFSNHVARRRDEDADGVLPEHIALAANALGYHATTPFVNEVELLGELVAIRNAILILGAPGTGKTARRKTLVKAKAYLNQQVSTHELVPGAVPTKELFGYYSEKKLKKDEHQQWINGILPKLIKGKIKQYTDPNSDVRVDKLKHENFEQHWIILDGNLTPLQTDLMPSLMDGKLRLPTHEQVFMEEDTRIIIETDSLDWATPCFISRVSLLNVNIDNQISNAGFVLVDWAHSTYEPRYGEDIASKIEGVTLLYHEIFCLDFVNNWFPESSTDLCNPLAIAETTMALFDVLYKHACLDLPQARCIEIVELCFNVCASSSLGNYMTVLYPNEIKRSRMLSDWWRNRWNIKYPSHGEIWDYTIDHKTHTLIPWSSILPDYIPTVEPFCPYASFCVPTVDVVKAKFFSRSLAESGRSILLAGRSGVGKTVIAKEILDSFSNLDTSDIMLASMKCNRKTTAKEMWSILKAKLECRSGRLYGPAKAHKQLAFMVDDLHLDKETSSLISFVRNVVGHGAIYDTESLFQSHIEGVSFLATTSITDDCSRSKFWEKSSRLLRHFTILGIPMPSESSLKTIFGSFLRVHMMAHKSNDLCNITEQLISTSICLHYKLQTIFAPSRERYHYSFDLRTLSTVLGNLCAMLKTPYDYNTDVILPLWIKLCDHSYGQQLISSTDLARFRQTVIESAERYFISVKAGGNKFKNFFCTSLPPSPDGVINRSGTGTTMSYKLSHEINGIKEVEKVMRRALKEYNSLYPGLKLCISDDVIDRVVHLSRVLHFSHRHTNAAVYGTDGRDLVRLVGSICGYNVIESPGIIPWESYATFQRRFTQILTVAGTKGDKSIIMIDSMSCPIDVLSLLNDFITVGYCGTVSHDDRIGIYNAIRSVLPKTADCDSEQLWSYFCERARSNLRIVFTEGSDGGNDINRIQRGLLFPSLKSSLANIANNDLGKEPLTSIAKEELKNVSVIKDEKVLNNVIQLLAGMHCSVLVESGSDADMTAKSEIQNLRFRSFVQCFAKQLVAIEEMVRAKNKHLHTVLKKLNEAAEQEEKMREIIEADDKTADANDRTTQLLLKQIGIDTTYLKKFAKRCSVGFGVNSVLASAIPVMEQECAKRKQWLDDIELQVKSIVNELTDEYLSELLELKEPSFTERKVFLLVALFCKSPDATIVQIKQFPDIPTITMWTQLVHMVSNFEEFRLDLVNLRTKTLSSDLIHYSQMQMDAQELNINEVEPSQYHPSILILLKWLHCALEFHVQSNEQSPIQKKLKEALEDQKVAERELKRTTSQLQRLEQRLGELKVSFEKATANKIAQKNKNQDLLQKLKDAQSFIVNLSGQKARWESKVLWLSMQQAEAIGTAAIIAGIVCYLGPFSKSFRASVMTYRWSKNFKNRGIPVEHDEDGNRLYEIHGDLVLQKLLKTSELLILNHYGYDSYFITNAAILSLGDNWPLMFDPHGLGMAHVIRIESRSGLLICDLLEGRSKSEAYIPMLERAITEGLPILLANIGATFDSSLSSFVAQCNRSAALSGCIMLAGNKTECKSGFRLYLHTQCNGFGGFKMENNVASNVTAISFESTVVGIEQTISAKIWERQRPDDFLAVLDLINQISHIESEADARDSAMVKSILSNEPANMIKKEIIGVEESFQKLNSLKQELLSRKLRHADDIINPFASYAARLYLTHRSLEHLDRSYHVSLSKFWAVFSGCSQEYMEVLDINPSKSTETSDAIVDDALLRSSSRIGVDFCPSENTEMSAISVVIFIKQQIKKNLQDMWKRRGDVLHNNTGEKKFKTRDLIDCTMSYFRAVESGFFEEHRILFMAMLFLYIHADDSTADRIDVDVEHILCFETDVEFLFASWGIEPFKLLYTPWVVRRSLNEVCLQGSLELPEWLTLEQKVMISIFDETRIELGEVSLHRRISENPSEWQSWVFASCPESLPLPENNIGKKRATSFKERMLHIRCLRPDRSQQSIENYVFNELKVDPDFHKNTESLQWSKQMTSHLSQGSRLNKK
eukprot:UC4_evm2s846